MPNENKSDDRAVVVVGKTIHEDAKIFAANSKGRYTIREIFTDGAREWLNSHKPGVKRKYTRAEMKAAVERDYQAAVEKDRKAPR